MDLNGPKYELGDCSSGQPYFTILEFLQHVKF